MLYLPDAERARRMTTEELRERFLLTGLFQPGAVTLQLVDLDRVVLGGAVPTAGELRLEAPAALRAEYFTERRELGVLNIGGPGTVVAGGRRYDLRRRDVLYVPRGTRDVTFSSASPDEPARFYLVSYPAHTERTRELVTADGAQSDVLGSPESANRRTIRRYIHLGGVRSDQLVMGVTVLERGSVWNTMPCHTHGRRSEIYLYFDLPADAVVVHLMGEPAETRSLIVRDGDVVLSPGWSVHTGCGTSSYAFCWAMGGENQDYADMDPVQMTTLR